MSTTLETDLHQDILNEWGDVYARTLLEQMCKIRAFEEEAEELYALGKVHGTMHLSIGQEEIGRASCRERG